MPIPPPVPIVETLETSTIGSCYKLFVVANPPLFYGREGTNKAEKWLQEIEKASDIVELPESLKVKYGFYILVGDVGF